MGCNRLPRNKKNSGRGQRELKATVKSARGKTVSQVKWLQRQLNDPYVKRAKAEGFRGRAAYPSHRDIMIRKLPL